MHIHLHASERKRDYLTARRVESSPPCTKPVYKRPSGGLAMTSRALCSVRKMPACARNCRCTAASMLLLRFVESAYRTVGRSLSIADAYAAIILIDLCCTLLDVISAAVLRLVMG